MKKRFYALAGVLASALIIFTPDAIHAATALGFAVSPPSAELTANPGQMVGGTVKVINLTDSTLSLVVDKNNFVARGEEGEVDLIEENTKYSLAPWFKVGPGKIDLPPRGTVSFSYSVDVPLDAEPGGRYGSLVFHTNPEKLPAGESGASIRQQLGMLIFLRINGTAHEQINIASFKTEKSFYEIGPIKFDTRISDTGNVHAKPTGTITIKNLFGMKVGTVDLEPKNVIPGATRHTESTFKKKWMLGVYKATLVLKNGDKQQLTASTNFTVVPYKLLAIILIVIIILYVLFWRSRKRFKRALRVLSGKE
jgi:hypothetical protein